jgi:thiol-disulfide isomerase/thioredoxin
MRNYSRSWLNLSLGSLAIAGVLITVMPVKISAAPPQAIAQANQGANVGGPLAKQLQGKPVVVDIYASWCAACKNIAPTLSQLKKEYAGKANFVVLDVSDRGKASQASARARQLGLGQYFDRNKSQTGMIAIIDPATGNILAQHRNNADKTAYTSVLNAALKRK